MSKPNLHTRDKDLIRLLHENLDLRKGLKNAISALRSYQYGNSDPTLAREVADSLEGFLNKGETKTPPPSCENFDPHDCIKRDCGKCSMNPNGCSQ